MVLEKIIFSALSVAWLCFSRLEEGKRRESYQQVCPRKGGFLYDILGEDHTLLLMLSLAGSETHQGGAHLPAGLRHSSHHLGEAVPKLLPLAF